MPELEPITREEMLLDGQDLEPITRKEMFIKRIYDKTQVIPEPITREEMFLKKAGDETTDVTIEQLNVSENGTYSEEGVAYSPVIVNVPETPLSKLTVTENGTYTAPSGTAYNEVEVDVPLPENAYLLKDIENTPTAIATFSDGANLPMPKLEVGIEPQQDLHGYDAPWVGGAGKNKLPYEEKTSTINGATFTTNSDGTISTSGTPTSSAFFVYYKPNLPTGEYKFFSNADTTKFRPYVSNATKGTSTNSGGAFSVDEGDEVIVYLQGYANQSLANQKVTMMICKSTETDTSWQPYSNICPISGWSAVDVTVADDVETPTVSNVYTIDLDGTRYGGKVDLVSGVMTLTDGFIASYNGETLPSTWISDRDVYAEGTTPTIGAEVCYKLATTLTIQLTPTQVKSLLGSNNVWCDMGKIEELEYFSKEV